MRKAWVEMIHRYAASTLGLLIVVITAFAIRARRERGVSVWFALGLLALVVFQGILGMLTVTWLLKPLIVTGHLLGGLTTFAMLLWLWLTLRAQDRRVDGASVLTGNRLVEDGSRVRLWATLALVALGLQIFLGGWTSSNYAAVACPDFPKCQAQWFPDADYEDAFVLWRGLGINYAGGVLDHPARVAIHFTHRLGAVLATLPAAAGRAGRPQGPWKRCALGGRGGAVGAGVATFHRGFHGVAGLPAAAGRRTQRRRGAAGGCHGAFEPQAAAGGGLLVNR